MSFPGATFEGRIITFMVQDLSVSPPLRCRTNRAPVALLAFASVQETNSTAVKGIRTPRLSIAHHVGRDSVPNEGKHP